MIRLQCPACQCIVKISPHTIGQHPVVRCARCQGLVPVAQCIVEETPAVRRRPQKRRRMRSSPVPLVIGITVGLVLLAGAGFAIYWLGFRGTSTAQIAKLKNDNIDNLSIDELQDRSFDMMNAMLDVFESIHSRADFEAAQTKMQDIEQAFERVSIKLAEKVSNLSPEESQAHRQRAMQRSLPKVTAFVQRSQSIVARLKANPELHQTLTRFTLYNNGSNLINPARRDSIARNTNKSVVEKNDYVPPNTLAKASTSAKPSTR